MPSIKLIAQIVVVSALTSVALQHYAARRG